MCVMTLRCRFVVAVFSLLFLSSQLPAAQSPRIREENAKPGSDDWQLTRVRLDKSDGMRSPAIEGYCSKQSVRAGETLDIFVSTDPPSKFKLEVFRTGYYGGKGARLVKEMGPFDGIAQPIPTPGEKNLHECKWKATTQLTIPDDWISGVYLGRLTTLPEAEDLPYWQSYVIFIVRDDRPADILFQCSDNTWQAYNQWPTKFSLYTHPKDGQGPWADVSFDRPYGRQSQYMAIVNDPLSVGSGEFLSFEQPMSYFLEQHGYDVTYCSNSDMLTAERGLKCKSFLSVGHDEYWDIRQFESVTKMRDAGVNLMFFSGNSVCWVTPFRASSDGRANRIIFRGGPYGAKLAYAESREKLHGPFPERGPDEGLLMGARNPEPINGGGDWTIARPENWIFAGTGVKKGDRIPGLVGWEYHAQPATEIPGLEVVA
ncbi:MAG TPA: N,N-dimethylformamidase beta subunit family domain-containing protein, partial [Caulifigura sp.]|nr:N,N-dimethylformamidase beta subunit family domain-containing protein [Caulifigura sp.]